MKFTIEKQPFMRELAFIHQSVIEKKSVLPALSHVRIEAIGKRVIRLTGTDLDLTITCETEGTIQKSGACALPARKLLEIVKNLPDAAITLETKANDRTEVTCDRSQFRLAGLSPQGLPELPKFKEAAFQLPSDVMRTMIERTRFSVTQDESRYALAGAKFVVRKKSARMVTTDGHRLSLIDNKSVTSPEEFACLIPKKTLGAISHLCGAHEGAIGFQNDENHIYLEIGTRTLISRLLAGQFPSYETIVPKSNDHIVPFECATLLQTVRRVAVMTDERSRAICLEFSRKKLRVFTDVQEQGAAEETLDISYKGTPEVIGLNASFLIEYLSAIATGAMSFEFKSPRDVVQLRPLDEAGFDSFALIMPMAITHNSQPTPAEDDDQSEELIEDVEQEESEAVAVVG